MVGPLYMGRWPFGASRASSAIRTGAPTVRSHTSPGQRPGKRCCVFLQRAVSSPHSWPELLGTATRFVHGR